MKTVSKNGDVLVIGGGPIGLASAWRLAQRGARVSVFDSGQPGAWRAAAGMLAPISEAEFGETPRLELALRSAEIYKDFCAELAEESGADPGYRNVGTLLVARDQDEKEELERTYAFRRSLKLKVDRLHASAARKLEPALVPSLRLALSVPADCSIDPFALMHSLRAALGHAGVEIHEGTQIVGVSNNNGRVSGVRTENGETFSAENVVLAAGAWSGELSGLPSQFKLPVRPVKGQSLRLRDPRGAGLIEHAVRTTFAYIVPRGDGRYVLGGTVEEQGWNLTHTAGGLFELIRDQSEVLPGVLELEIEGMSVGARPGTPDNLPIIGRALPDGLVLATGHYRNGVLLAPITAELVADEVFGKQPEPWAKAFSPERFYNV